jgi:hypothetical protein
MGKGRLVGSRNKAQLELDKIGMSKSKEVVHRLVEMALTGEAAYMKMLMDRIWPVSRTSTDSFVKGNLKGILTQADINEAFTNILEGVGESEVSLEQADTLASLIKAKSESIHKCMAEELQELKDFVNSTKTPE